MMVAIADYLLELDKQRDKLAENLNTMGVIASNTEKFNTLVPKVLQIPQEGGEGKSKKIVLFNAETRDSVYLKHNDNVYSVDEFTAIQPDFCSEENNFSLNYDSSIFGWDNSMYSCSTISIDVNSETMIAIKFISNSNEDGILRLVKSETNTAEDILTNAQTEGKYIDLPFQWVYTSSYIITITECTIVEPGKYYLVWVGRSNNIKPIIQSIMIIN